MSVMPLWTFSIRFWPSLRMSPVRNTAQLFCITCCMPSRSFAVGVPPEA